MSPESLILMATMLPIIGSLLISAMGWIRPESSGRRVAMVTLLVTWLTAFAGLVLRGGLPFEVRSLFGRSDEVAAPFELVHLDPLSLIWILLSTAFSLHSLIVENGPAGTPFPSRQSRNRLQLILLLVSLTAAATLTLDVWCQWGATAIAGWALCGLLAIPTPWERAGSVRSALVWLLAADLAWLVGATQLQGVIGPWNLRLLSNWTGYVELTTTQESLAVVGAALLLFSLMLRLGLFPVSVWTNGCYVTPVHAGWIALFGFGLGVILLARWAPVLTPFGEIRTLLLGLGGMSAALLAISAWAREEHQHRCLRIAGGQMGLVAMGIAASPGQELQFTLLGLTSLAMVGLLAWGLDRGQVPHRMIELALLVFGIGVLGHEAVFNAIQTMSIDEGRSPWPLLLVALFGQGLMTYTLLDSWRRQRGTEAVGTSITALQRASVGGLLLVLLGIAILPDWIGGQTPDGQTYSLGFSEGFPVATPLLMLIAWTALQLLPPAIADAHRTGGLVDSFRRLGTSDFNVPLVVERLVTVPIVKCSQGFARLHDVVLERVIRNWTSRFTEQTAEQCDESDEQSDSTGPLVLMLVTSAVLAVAVLIGRWR